MEYVVRALKCGRSFTPTGIFSKRFDYLPPEPLAYTKGVESCQHAHHNRQVRDYGWVPATYRSLTYEIRGDEVGETEVRIGAVSLKVRPQRKSTA